MAPPKVDDEYRNQIENASKNLDTLISKDKHYYAPRMLRLALHDAGIYGLDIGTNRYLIKRGPNGSIRTPMESAHPSNKGLQEIVDVIEDQVKKNNGKITYADLYQLAGVAAVKSTGGPDIKFEPGREDSTEPPQESDRELPAKRLDESALEEIKKRMGLEEKDMVALVGGLCQWHESVKSAALKPGQNQPTSDGTAASFQFDNSYFINLQERDQSNPLLKGKGFRPWVHLYAKVKDSFAKDYAEAHQKVSELSKSTATSSAKEGEGRKTDQNSTAPISRKRLLQGIGLAVVTTAIIVGFILSRRSK